MEKHEILQRCIMDFDGAHKRITSAVFAVARGIIKSIARMQGTDREKKERLVKVFTGLANSKSDKVLGVKKEELRRAAAEILGISCGRLTKQSLKSLSFEEILYYFCCYERLTKANVNLKAVRVQQVNGQEGTGEKSAL